jgi:vacuolar protein sorting-associated protein 41
MEENNEKKGSSENDEQGLQEENAAHLEMDDNTRSLSSQGDDDDEDWDGANVENEAMPALSYSRLFGSLPRRSVSDNNGEEGLAKRTFPVASTCSVMAQVLFSQQDVIPQTPTASTATAAATSTSETTSNADHSTPDPNRRRQLPQASAFVHHGDPLLSRQPHWVLAMGYANGSVELVDARTGVAVAPSEQLHLRDASHQPEPIVDLSMDSSGTFLAAVDAGRMVVIWEFQYTITSQQPQPHPQPASINSTASPTAPQPMQPSQQQQAPTSPAEAGVFSSFMSAFAGTMPSPLSSTSTNLRMQQNQSTSSSSGDPSSSMVQRLATFSIQLSRISYPRSFGTPTCIAIDPAYKRRRERAVLTGFSDGRLVLTKRGFVFQRRTDAIIYQGAYHENNGHRGIEAIEWRGSLAAWADAR